MDKVDKLKDPSLKALDDTIRVPRVAVSRMSQDYVTANDHENLFGFAFAHQISEKREVFNRVAGFIASPDLKYPLRTTNFKGTIGFITEKYKQDGKELPIAPSTISTVYRIIEDPNDKDYMLFNLETLDGVDNKFNPETESFLPNPNYQKGS